MRRPHQHPDSGSWVYAEKTFIQQFVLPQHAITLLAADTFNSNQAVLPPDAEDDFLVEIDSLVEAPGVA